MLSELFIQVRIGVGLLCEEYITRKCCEGVAEVQRTTKKMARALAGREMFRCKRLRWRFGNRRERRRWVEGE